LHFPAAAAQRDGQHEAQPFEERGEAMHVTAIPCLFAFVAACSCATAQETVYPASDQPPPQHPVYKCDGRTYTHVPCAGGHALGTPRVSVTYSGPPPQDRARQMARAQLPAETRARCASLETSIHREEARLRSKGVAATEEEKGDLAIQRVNYREMRC
jgi:hypothetical protein